MRVHALASTALLLLAAVALPSTAVAAPPLCFGQPATHVMQPGDPPYFGTAGDDVVVGSEGDDGIGLFLSGGTDLACGGGGDDEISVLGAGSKVDGGVGNDQIIAYSGLAQGGSGDDVVQADGTAGRAEGGSGDDGVLVANGATADGGSGNDSILGTRATALLGGSGSDYVRNGGGNPKIDCGSAFDTVTPFGATDVRRCEQVV